MKLLKQLPVDLDLTHGILTDTYIQRLSVASKGGYVWIDEHREILMSVKMFSEMLRLIYDVHGSNGGEVIYEMGRRAGARWAQVDLKKKGVGGARTFSEAIYYIAQLCGLVGYGEIRLDPDLSVEEYPYEMALHLHGSVEVDACLLGDLPKTKCCRITTGFVSGYMSEFFSRNFEFNEIFCRGEGHGFCKIFGRERTSIKHNALFDDRSFGAATMSHESRGPLIYTEIDGAQPIIGNSKGLRDVYQRLVKAAPTSAAILIQGETGVGKEIFAREAHRLSGRSGNFVAFNGGALPDSLVESELFGVDKGAFSGADRVREGRFERANNGTLFIDEVANLSPSAQVKLLRAIQEGEIEHLGGSRPIKIDARIVCASNVDLLGAVQAGAFREDLYFRISTLKLNIPPLRERRQDVMELLDYHLYYYSNKYNKGGLSLADDARRALLNYDYPGNVRELASIVEAAVVMADSSGILDLLLFSTNLPRLNDCAISLRKRISGAGHDDNSGNPQEGWRVIARQLVEEGVTVSNIESEMIAAALEDVGGNITKAAKKLGLTRRQLSYLSNK